MMLLDNTQDYFKKFADEYKTLEREDFERRLRAILNRVIMDTRNHISRQMTDFEIQITNLPHNKEEAK